MRRVDDEVASSSGVGAGGIDTVALFLAGREGSYPSGSEFDIDGGLSAGVPHRNNA